jgi:hypothetical protein
MCTKLSSRNLKARECLKDKIRENTVKCGLTKWDGRAWTGFVLLRIGFSSGLL